jgi:hypothetical protein
MITTMLANHPLQRTCRKRPAAERKRSATEVRAVDAKPAPANLFDLENVYCFSSATDKRLPNLKFAKLHRSDTPRAM